MRVAVASDDGVTIAVHTGRCQYLVVYELDGEQPQKLEIRRNDQTAHAQGLCTEDHSSHEGSEHEHHSHTGFAQLISDCCALISQGMGRRLVQDLTACGILPVFCDGGSVEDAVRKYGKGELPNAGQNSCCK